MKLNINGKEVDLIVNGSTPDFLAKKAKLSDKGLNPDEEVRKKREALEKAKKDGEG